MKKIINKLFLTLITVTLVGGVTGSIYNTVLVIHDNYLQHSYKCSLVETPKDFLTDTEMVELQHKPCANGFLTYDYRWGDRDTVEFPLWTFLLKNLASWLPFLLLFGFGYWARWLIK